MPWSFRSAVEWVLPFRPSAVNAVDDVHNTPQTDDATLEADLDKDALRKVGKLRATTAI